jgi:hypothetical protein
MDCLDEDGVVPLVRREEESEIFGLRSFSPLDGESAEKRWCEVDDSDEGGAPVDDFRGVGNPMDSRVPFRSMLPELLPGVYEVEADAGAETCRVPTGREIAEGEVLNEARDPTAVALGVESSLAGGSMTPNSLAETVVEGDGFKEAGVFVLVLPEALSLPLGIPDTDPFTVGEGAVEVRLDILGIFVGVSFGSEEDVIMLSFECAPWWDAMDTEGDPAIVGSWFLDDLKEESDCFCIELTVWDVNREELLTEPPLEVEVGVDGVDNELEDDLRLATRCAVAGFKAVICMGGSAVGGLERPGSADESVLPLFLPISTESLPSLFSSPLFLLSLLSELFSLGLLIESLPSRPSLCRLLLELLPLRREGSPSERTLVFFSLAPVVAVDTEEDGYLEYDRSSVPPDSLSVEELGEWMEKEVLADGGGNCMDWDEERLKKGIEDGVRRLLECLWTEAEDGLSGPRSLGGTPGEPPVELIEARLAAELMASVDHPTLPPPEADPDPGERGCSFEVDFLNVLLTELLGLEVDEIIDLRWELPEGEPPLEDESLILRAFEKLHFFEGVLWTCWGREESLALRLPLLLLGW